MKLCMKLFKKRKKNNSGISLIEIVLAIAVLAIVMTPVFNSFITSARVNMKARQTMAATNVAQTIMEGFADKRYPNIKTFISNISGVDQTGPYALSSVNENYYNMKDHSRQLGDTAGTVLYAAGLNAVSANQISITGSIYNSVDLVSGNNPPVLGSGMGADTVSINRVIAQAVKQDLETPGADNKALLYWTGGTNQLLAAIVYTDIEMEGYHFDAVVSFIPMAKSNSDQYYSYCVTVTVYDAEYDPDGDGIYAERLQDEALLNVMLGGMANDRAH